MAEEQKIQKMLEIQRTYEQPQEAISFYCDFGQILHSGNEIVMQFYETIPGVPDSGGANIKNARTRLRATITVSFPHAQNIGKLLIEKAKGVIEK